MSQRIAPPIFEQHQARFEFAQLGAVPGAWRGRVARLHAAKKTTSLALANLWLLGATERMQALRVPLTLTDAELCEYAEKCAKEAFALAECVPGVWSGAGELRHSMGRYCIRYGITPPPDTVTDAGAIARMSDGLWWRRKLRASQARALEAEAIRLGYVHRKAEIYASDVTVERRKQQKARNLRALENTEAVNTVTGDIYTLAELAELSVSSPRIRRGELMTRIAGFEAVAVGMGHAAEFWTATAPSRMHPKRTGTNGAVLDNPKYDGTTPRQAQQYLAKTWANFRAACWRRNIRFYGFRIAEPHHDATPHWHLLLFMPQEITPGRGLVARARALFRRYFLREDGAEAGAKKNRVEFVGIDWKRGSAAGYIAKYVSKNIDGYAVQGDLEGENLSAVTGSQRVEAWASSWGIRQFQQVGGPPVGVWRELRKMGADDGQSEAIFEARSAADIGNWARYVGLQGGPVVSRKALSFRIAYTRAGERWDANKGEPVQAGLNRYGEEAAPAVFGVRDCVLDRAFCSRFHKWEMRRAGVGVAADFSPPWTCVNNCSRGGEGEINRTRRFTRQGSGAGDAVAGFKAVTATGTGVNHEFGGNHQRYGCENRGIGGAR